MSVTRTPRPEVLVVPGLNGSGPGHWQSVWERRDPTLRRVEQASWSEPRLGEWSLTLERAVAAAPAQVVLVAHSLGCALVAHWARAGSVGRVAAALLVAPADLARLGQAPAHGFAPVPLERLPFDAWLVASEDDPFCGIEHARVLARAWGARLLEAGPLGHVNVASGHGAWPEGEALLSEIRAAAAGATTASPGPRTASLPGFAVARRARATP